jgi:hypothetical protein
MIFSAAAVNGYTNSAGSASADSLRIRARFLRCIPSQVCFEPLTRTSAHGSTRFSDGRCRGTAGLLLQALP